MLKSTVKLPARLALMVPIQNAKELEGAAGLAEVHPIANGLVAEGAEQSTLHPGLIILSFAGAELSQSVIPLVKLETERPETENMILLLLVVLARTLEEVLPRTLTNFTAIPSMRWQRVMEMVLPTMMLELVDGLVDGLEASALRANAFELSTGTNPTAEGLDFESPTPSVGLEMQKSRLAESRAPLALDAVLLLQIIPLTTPVYLAYRLLLLKSSLAIAL